MRAIRSVGVLTDSDGGVRNAVVDIEVDGGCAKITIAATIDEHGNPDKNAQQLPTTDRRIAYFLGRVEETIRRNEYINRQITPDPKPNAKNPVHSKRRQA